MEPKDWCEIKKITVHNANMELLKSQVIQEEKELLDTLPPGEQFDFLISKLNYFRRKHEFTIPQCKRKVRVGDVCYVDFGNAYRNEIGYLHFGLILQIDRVKVFILPITGSFGNSIRTMHDRDNIIVLGENAGLKKTCACFLNDTKWISLSRIIDIKGHIDTQSDTFKDISEKVVNKIKFG